MWVQHNGGLQIGKGCLLFGQSVLKFIFQEGTQESSSISGFYLAHKIDFISLWAWEQL